MEKYGVVTDTNIKECPICGEKIVNGRCRNCGTMSLEVLEEKEDGEEGDNHEKENSKR